MRKTKGESVGAPGTLGALLDGRKKPPPSADDEKTIQQEKIREAIQIIANGLFEAGFAGIVNWDAKSLNEHLTNAYVAFGITLGDLGFKITYARRDYAVNDDGDDVPLLYFEFELALQGEPPKVFAGRVYGEEEKKGPKVKDSMRLEERLTKAREEVKSSTPPKEDQVTRQKICSDTEVEWLSKT